MSNRYYNHSTYPPFNSFGASQDLRTELELVEAGFATTQAEMDLKAALASPALTGTPTAPTAAADTNTTQIASTAYAKKEADDAQAYAIQRGNHTGTQAQSTIVDLGTDLGLKAPLASPTFTGTPAAPTATPGTSTTQVATTAFAAALSFASALPSQTGNSGKIVTTDGATASWADTLSDNSLSRIMFKDCGYTVVDKGNISNATVTFDYTVGSVQTYTATGSTVTWAFSNPPPTGNLGELLILGTNMGAYTHTITGITWIKPDGTTTTSVATYLAANGTRTSFQTSGVDQILVWTRDAGTTWYGKVI